MPSRFAIAGTGLLLVLLAPLPPALADGKFFSRHRVPPELPFQQALLAFDGEEERLVVQPKFEGAIDEFGWAELTRDAERPLRGEGFDLPWLTKFRGILAPDRDPIMTSAAPATLTGSLGAPLPALFRQAREG